MKWRLDPGQIEVVDDAVAEILRGKTTAERGEMIAGMWRTAQQLIEGHVRTHHPEWTDEQVRDEVRRRLSGDRSE